MRLNILENGEYSLGITSLNAERYIDVTEEDGMKISMGCKVNILENDNYEIIETEEYLQNIEKVEKSEKIAKFKDKKVQAEKLRLEYLTAELLPEGENRTMILVSLEEKRHELAQVMDSMISEFIDEYGGEILQELIL